jgi:hypothetical protein
MERKRCPDCDGFDTERVHTEWFTDMLEETRICNDCPAQFRNKYSLFEQSLDEVPA